MSFLIDDDGPPTCVLEHRLRDFTQMRGTRPTDEDVRMMAEEILDLRERVESARQRVRRLHDKLEASGGGP